MITKKCTTCGEIKSISDEFYKSNKSHCKECVKARVRKNRAVKIDYYREFDKRRASLPHRVAAREAYKKTDRGKETLNRSKQAWSKRNKPKRQAQGLVAYYLRAGKLTREPCEICGSTKRIHAHHDDYSKPLEVRWLCPKHHSEWHKHNTPVGA